MFRFLRFTLTLLTLSIFQAVTYLLLQFFQAFKETAKLFSIEVLLICIANNSIYALAFLHIFSSICCFFLTTDVYCTKLWNLYTFYSCLLCTLPVITPIVLSSPSFAVLTAIFLYSNSFLLFYSHICTKQDSSYENKQITLLTKKSGFFS